MKGYFILCSCYANTYPAATTFTALVLVFALVRDKWQERGAAALTFINPLVLIQHQMLISKAKNISRNYHFYLIFFLFS